VVYPYALGDAGSIYDSTFGTGYYYYFYDWQIKKEEKECTSPRIEVMASVVGIDELTNPLGIRIYPNPVQNVLTLSCSSNLNVVQVNVVDAMGRTVLKQQMNMAGKSINTVDVSGLAAGVYHVAITSAEQRSTIEFVKE